MNSLDDHAMPLIQDPGFYPTQHDRDLFTCFASNVSCSAAAIYILWKKYGQNYKHCQKIKNVSPKVVFLVSNVDDWQTACDVLMEDLSSLKVLLF